MNNTTNGGTVIKVGIPNTAYYTIRNRDLIGGIKRKIINNREYYRLA